MAKRQTAKRLSTAERAAQSAKRAARRAARFPAPEMELHVADSSPASDPHARFRDQCVTYGDFHREVLLQEICRFLKGADSVELAIIRRRVVNRQKQLPKGERGRPAVANSETGLYRGRRIAWWHVIEGATWKEIAEKLEYEPTKGNIRTVQRWFRDFADEVRRAIPHPPQPGESDAAWIERMLANRAVCQLIRIRTGLPFNDAREDCARIVQAILAPANRE